MNPALQQMNKAKAIVWAYVRKCGGEGSGRPGPCPSGEAKKKPKKNTSPTATLAGLLSKDKPSDPKTLYSGLSAKHSGMTTGTYHDAIRSMIADGSAVGVPWKGGPIENLPDPNLAFFSGGKLTYDVQGTGAAPTALESKPLSSDAAGHAAQAVRQYKEQHPGDAPLSAIHEALKEKHPDISIGQFHDTLRKLHDAGTIRLSGWSGPLENIPHQNLATLVGHKVMYYARPGT